MESSEKDILESLSFIVANMATKDDIAELRTELKGDVSELRTELKGDITELKAELKGDTAEHKSELKGDISELRTELKGDIAELREDIKRLEISIRGIREDLDALIETVNGMKGYTVEIDELRERVTHVERELEAFKQTA